MRGAPMRGGAGRKTVSMLDLLRGENLLGISVDDSREKVLAELGEPSMQDIYLASGGIFYRYHDVEMAFYDDNDKLCYVVFYGKGQRGKFRLPWFIKDKDRIRRDITYENMTRLLEKNNIWYALRASVGGYKHLDVKNGEMSFYDACDNGNFILHALYFNRI
ncbi:hypothetical protein [Ancylobacter rudongensis]|uniref:hypothetical protein n=1 Tax=Ancylobacter rudongensis TaxID=177413 RepID=UPI0011600291|nr:hypothetical protein [Ancylobacter rudongensis]